jgi:hypothetical protein
MQIMLVLLVSINFDILCDFQLKRGVAGYSSMSVLFPPVESSYEMHKLHSYHSHPGIRLFRTQQIRFSSVLFRIFWSLSPWNMGTSDSRVANAKL